MMSNQDQRPVREGGRGVSGDALKGGRSSRRDGEDRGASSDIPPRANLASNTPSGGQAPPETPAAPKASPPGASAEGGD